MLELDCAPVRRGEPCAVAFRILTMDAQSELTVRPVWYTVDFLDPGGALAERRKGLGSSSELATVQGAFTQAGTGAVIVRCVTDQGVSAAARVELPVAD